LCGWELADGFGFYGIWGLEWDGGCGLWVEDGGCGMWDVRCGLCGRDGESAIVEEGVGCGLCSVCTLMYMYLYLYHNDNTSRSELICYSPGGLEII